MRWLVLVLVAGCVQNPLVICDNGRACPVGFVCDLGHDTCVLPTQLDACEGKDDGVRCTYPGVPAGTCFGGVCFPAVCGGGFVDADEECDDGNQVSGDGCSSDCMFEVCGNARLDAGETCDDGDLASSDGCSSGCTPERPDWRQLSLAPVGYRLHPALAHDELRGRTVLFGGANAGITSDTWEWGGRAWTSLKTLSGPSPRLASSAAYDAARKEVVLFGGLVGGTLVGNDTWVYDGVRWRQRMPATSPPARNRGAVAYDARRAHIVLFGGFDGTSRDDTWEWDGTTWTEHPVATHPSPRTGNAIAYDPASGVTLLAGGIDIDGQPVSPIDTWAWDGTAWTRKTPATTPAGATLAMGFDVARGRVVLLTSVSNAARWWEWTGSDWLAVPARDLAAPLQDGSRLFYDHGLQRLVVFGVLPGNAMAMYELGPSGWVVAPDPVAPPAREGTAMAYDTVTGDVAMFGGRDLSATLLDDLWTWDGARWTEVPAQATWPEPRDAHAMVFDAARGELLVVGGRTAAGRTGDTWAWNGRAWRLAGSLPPHEQLALAYDARRRRVVAFGGTALGFDGFDHHVAETWEWNGTTWTEIAIGGGPPARSNHAMVYDALRDRIVMFGGASEYATFNDLWELDGAVWQQRTSSLVPQQRSGPVMAFSANRGMTVMTGGRASPFDGGGPLGDTWEWDGANWTPIATFSTPSRRTDRAGAYHAGTARVVMFGGGATETWLYGYDGDRPPETCGGGLDVDGDARVGCADPDCWWRCNALCPPNTSCSAEAPHCGDGTCSPLESCRLCPADCGTCTPRCGDHLCDDGETCPGDCG